MLLIAGEGNPGAGRQFEAGEFQVIHKPFGIREFLVRVRRILAEETPGSDL